MKLISKLSELLYPPRCPCCGELNDSPEPCDDCAKGIVDQCITGKVCRYCGLEKIHCECKQYHYLFEGIAAPFYNRDTAQSGVYRLKFQNSPYSAPYFAKCMAECFRDRFQDVEIDLVCIVPSTGQSLRERRYDYVELLARPMAQILQLPFDKKALRKVRRTERQHTLTHDKRQANVKGAYRAPKRLDGKTVLLVDDIKTTGYTLNECAKQLRMAGAEKVYCVTALISSNKSCNPEETGI